MSDFDFCLVIGALIVGAAVGELIWRRFFK